ncbi:acyl-CoA synthetase FdrA [Erysipelothrix urinaevulpis]|uniref:acyl-CoA synthetase FdrA n=1 Tax=Erysipelothrix urinaevulpis TaxID=2683717 RepID=UPI0013579AD2|nr:acyl-CoA synthetase FdrA [Erysipelothrix urinaevulpis]
MYRTIIMKNSYKDSIVLMLLTNEISALEGVKKISVMMATDANKSIFEGSGMLTPEVEQASANDIAIVADVESDEIEELMMEKIEEFLNQSDSSSDSGSQTTVETWNQAMKAKPDANLAVISVPGIYAAHEAHKALDNDLNVFMFSDNVSLEDEAILKHKALNKNLMVMGPDSGTGIIKGLPVAFTNKVANGSIGLVGASGTGIQEITTLVHKMGKGISSALGTGGRDLHDEIGGVTMLQSIKALKDDENTNVIVVLSKPSSKKVQDKINDYINTLDKPVVTLFLGEKPVEHSPNIYRAYTLAEAARAAVMFDNNQNPIKDLKQGVAKDVDAKQTNKVIKAYYSGGTLASEASMLISKAVGIPETAKDIEGVNGFDVIDLGDDQYTQGKPHPMIDPGIRIDYLKNAAKSEDLGVVLFDVVIGYGSHDDMATALAPAIVDVMNQKPDVSFVASVCGTNLDKQGYDNQVQILEDLGVIVCESNQEAVLTALEIIGKPLTLESLPLNEKETTSSFDDEIYQSNILDNEPKVINVGLEGFYQNILDAQGDAIQYTWKPVAGGNLELIQALQFLDNVKEI